MIAFPVTHNWTEMGMAALVAFGQVMASFMATLGVTSRDITGTFTIAICLTFAGIAMKATGLAVTRSIGADIGVMFLLAVPHIGVAIKEIVEITARTSFVRLVNAELIRELALYARISAVRAVLASSIAVTQTVAALQEKQQTRQVPCLKSLAASKILSQYLLEKISLFQKRTKHVNFGGFSLFFSCL